MANIHAKKSGWRSYYFVFIPSFCIIISAYIISFLINTYHPLNQDVINFIGMFGVGCDATAIYGFLEWKIKSSHEKILSEKFNHTLTIVCISLGCMCYALTYLLKPVL